MTESRAQRRVLVAAVSYVAICVAQLTIPIRPLGFLFFFVWPYPLLLSVQLLCDPGSMRSIVLADLAGLVGVIAWGAACERMWTGADDAVTAGRVIFYVIAPPAILTLLAALTAWLFGWPTGE